MSNINDNIQNRSLIYTLDEEQLKKKAQDLSAIAKKGDAFLLYGDLGMGKTTFARSFIRSLLNAGEETEIPSPSFSLVQTYETERFNISHFDFYRINSPYEIQELGLDQALDEGIALIEWPENAGEDLPKHGLKIIFSENDDPDERQIELIALDGWNERLRRFKQTEDFLAKTPWHHANRTFLQGDASSRLYTRLDMNGEKSILMDAPKKPDGPSIKNGKSYSQISHLAEDVVPFVAIAKQLRTKGIYTPDILEHNITDGFLIIEDLGNNVLGQLIASGTDTKSLYQKAVDVLVKLRNITPPDNIKLSDDIAYKMPSYNEEALNIEIELLLEWYWLAIKKQNASDHEKDNFFQLWNEQLTHVQDINTHWVLRDYHSPNLILLEADKTDTNSVGVIDFQDAQRGHAAYDLVSLLQDARLDIPKNIETDLLQYYCDQCSKQDLTGQFDETEFRRAYAILGAQRNTKILGIFARLSMRDGKDAYLSHIPRIWNYLERNFQHPELQKLKNWYDEHFPAEVRTKTLDI